jgi:predicted Zn-dependent peptidase
MITTRFTFAAVALATLLFAPAGALASAKQPLPKDLPPFGADKPLPVASITRSVTPEGLTVWLVPRAGFPRVTAVLVVRGGSASDPKGAEGIAELLAATITEGTATRSAQQIAEALQSVGGTVTAEAGTDAIWLVADGLGSGAGQVLEALGDVARNASFPPAELELARSNALQGLLARASTPEFLADKAFAAAVYGDHPYRQVAPEPAVLQAATRAQLQAEQARRFRPDGALLVLVGAFDPAMAQDAIARAFGGWKGRGAPLEEPPAPPVARGRDLAFVARPGSVQSTLRVGRTGPAITDPDYFAIMVADAVYGGGFASRLTENIREDKGYTYSPGSSFMTRRLGGLLQVDADVRNEVTAATLMEIFYELDRMGTTEVPGDELRTAQRLQTGLYLYRNQRQASLARRLASLWLQGAPPEFLGEYVPRINAVTAAQVRAVGRRLFASERQTVVVVGDEAVKAELEQFGPVRTVQP